VRPYHEKTLHKKGLMEWLKGESLSSNPGTTHTKLKRYKSNLGYLSRVKGSGIGVGIRLDHRE
jgi:hypothetical protein